MNLISEAVAASELGVSVDARLLRIVSAVQEDFRKSTGRTFEEIERVAYVPGFGPYVNYTFLPESPVSVLTEVRYDPSGLFGDETIVDVTEFYVEGHKLHWRCGYFEEGPRVAMVTNTAGYAEDAIPVDLQSDLYDEVFARYRRGSDEQFLSVSVSGAESFTRGKLGPTMSFDRAVRRYRRPI
jgi:hypothetical protein